MSRSFHSNIRKYINEKNHEYANDNIKEERLNQIIEEAFRKRCTKKKTIFHRKASTKMVVYENPFDINAIEINVKHESDYIHFPACREDLLGVMKRLPYNIVSGIQSIALCLGKEYQEKKVSNKDTDTRDPFTGRLCSDEEGPVYTPLTLGTYYPDNCKIFIYSYVYHRDELKLNVIEPYLRLQMLSTLVHEIAHHEDNMIRTSRGRWLGFNDWKCEDYAEFQQMNWSKSAIIPYLMDTYPDEYNALSNWIEKHGGVRFPLEKLAGESKGRRIGDRVKLVFSASSAVEYLFENIINGIKERDAMLEFAKDLQCGDYYEECQESLDTILQNNPKDSGALGVKAETYFYQKKYDKAEETAKQCLLIDNVSIDALRVLCDVKSNLKDWQGLKEISELGIKAAEDDKHEIRVFTQRHIIALLYLKEYGQARKAANTLSEVGIEKYRKLAFQALVRVCSGDTYNAFSLVGRVLERIEIIGPDRAILKAIYNYVVVKNDINIQKYELSKYEHRYLKNTDFLDLLKI
ncbi:MAG: hypothetical protein Q8936_22915 [Bacillota bacterium]|nr:hypothetical protein [Bacillota bacterium]